MKHIKKENLVYLRDKTHTFSFPSHLQSWTWIVNKDFLGFEFTSWWLFTRIFLCKKQHKLKYVSRNFQIHIKMQKLQENKSTCTTSLVWWEGLYIYFLPITFFVYTVGSRNACSDISNWVSQIVNSHSKNSTIS